MNVSTSNGKTELKKEYNPFEHRVVPKPVSDVRAFASISKSCLASGLLAGPLAFSNSGWGIGIVGTILIGIVCGHCMHILVQTSRGSCLAEKKPSLGYADTCAVVFKNGPKCLRRFADSARVLAEIAMVCTYLGSCFIYVVLISDSVKQLVDQYVPTMTISVEYYCLMVLVPLCVLCQIRYLKFLSICSIIANILLFGTYLICLYYIFKDKLSLDDKIIAGNPTRYPVFLSTVLFAMEGVGVVMPVENTMKTPEHCTRVLTAAMSVVTFLYSTLGLFGYFKYGAMLRGSITLNLPTEEWTAVCAKVFIAVSILLTFPLQFYVAYDVFYRYTMPQVKTKYVQITEISARIVGVVFCVGVGMALPLLDQIINIVGALFFSILGLIIPPVIDTIFRWENLGKFKWILWKNIFIALLGVICLIAGCTVGTTDIIKILRQKVE